MCVCVCVCENFNMFINSIISIKAEVVWLSEDMTKPRIWKDNILPIKKYI
jgi:hypothetical protein